MSSPPMEPPAPDEPLLYFAYGTNMDAEAMARRAPGARLLGLARLASHRVVFVQLAGLKAGVADLRPDETATAHGLLWSLEPRDLERLDTYEGVPEFYRRERVTVVAADGPLPGVWTYRAQDPLGPGRPSSRHADAIRKAASVHGFPCPL